MNILVFVDRFHENCLSSVLSGTGVTTVSKMGMDTSV